MAQRRGQNEGSIYQRKDGRWVGALSLSNGKRKYYYGKTRTEVRYKLKAAQRALEDGVDLRAGRLSVGAFLDKWLAAIKPAVKPRTWQGYESICRVRVSTSIKKTALAKLTPLDMQSLYADLEASGLSARSIHHTHRCLHRAFVQAVRWNMIVRNPCDGATAPTPRRAEFQIWSSTQARQLLDSVRDDAKSSALYSLALTTGMRQGELLGLRWCDVDLTGGTLRVNQTLHRRKGIPTFDAPKTARSRRVIVLGRIAREALQRHRDGQACVRHAARDLWTDNDLVFANATGGPLAPSWVTARFKAAAAGAGVTIIRFHDLRHTAATIQLIQGTHPKVVSEMLGHATIALTLDVYSHWVPSLHEAAASAADVALGA